MKKIAVCLMVKNEEHIIERYLQNVIRIADKIIITDTGSTDTTIIKAGLFLQRQGVPFKIYTEKFQNFAYNRTFLLKMAALEQDIDYALIVDADDIINYPEHFDPRLFKESLSLDAYHIYHQEGVMSYLKTVLVSNKRPWQYIGVTHEFLQFDMSSQGVHMGIAVTQINDSTRRKSKRKNQEDIELLSNAIKTEKDERLLSRYYFYLGQSATFNQQFDIAIPAYLERVKRGGWEEEIYYSYYMLGNCYRLGHPEEIEKIIYYYLKAYEVCPHRIESLSTLLSFLESIGMTNLADKMIRPLTKNIPIPSDGLFIQRNLYEDKQTI